MVLCFIKVLCLPKLLNHDSLLWNTTYTGPPSLRYVFHLVCVFFKHNWQLSLMLEEICNNYRKDAL